MRRIVLWSLLTALLYAGSNVVSSIPLPKTYIQNLNPNDCDTRCLAHLIRNEQVFSFIAQMPEPTEDPELNEQRLIYVSLFNLEGSLQKNSVRIAMLLPERVIGRYAASTTNSVMAYLLGKNHHFELQSFSVGTESREALQDGLARIADKGFDFIIAPLTKNGAKTLASLASSKHIYIPTVNHSDVNVSSKTLYFGGIDYQAQIDLLMPEIHPPLVIFYDKSDLGKELKSKVIDAYARLREAAPYNDASSGGVYAYAVDKHTTNLSGILKNNAKIKQGTFVLNTPLVKNGMIMSQLTLYDVNASRVLSTQISYNPLLFDITQAKDRTTMIVANSIALSNSVLIESNMLLGNDIEFDWINHAAALGADYFYHLSTGTPREFNLPMVANQIQYPVHLYQPKRSRFIPYVPADDPSDNLETFLPIEE